MTTVEVESAVLSSIGWDQESGLTVQFKNGSRYNYPGVDYGTWADFQAAESKGKFFKANIQGKYDGSKL